MEPTIRLSPEKKLTGRRLSMSLAANRTPELWKSFMQARKQITNAIGTDLYSVQVYHDLNYFQAFDPQVMFDKWAAVEASDHTVISEGMENFTLPAGLYAVFIYKGAASAAGAFFQYIFTEWLPASVYEFDNRPHFEILGEKYKNNDPLSEEEVWIPVRKK